MLSLADNPSEVLLNYDVRTVEGSVVSDCQALGWTINPINGETFMTQSVNQIDSLLAADAVRINACVSFL